MIRAYRARISGPLLDRIDLQVAVSGVSPRELRSAARGETSQQVRERVLAARQRQLIRLEGTGLTCNAHLRSREIERWCQLSPEGSALLVSAIERLGLSARANDRVLKVARTLADLEGRDDICLANLAEAIQYRQLDREEAP